jgi:hypothetical protein
VAGQVGCDVAIEVPTAFERRRGRRCLVPTERFGFFVWTALVDISAGVF